MPTYCIILIILTAIAGSIALAAAAAFLAKSAKRRKGRKKGKEGEALIASLLKKCMQKGDTLLNNVVLSNPRTKASFEIDHILLSRRGIFVVETKNRSGDIYGDDVAENWTQVLGKGNIRHEFYSPAKQCIAHAEKVASVTKCEKVYPVVVFAEGNTQFIDSKITFSPREMCDMIGGCKNVLGARELDGALRLLKDCMAQSISAKEHVKNIRKKYGKG